ncbi:NrsF family protein [Caballeronia sp. LjRoot31]|uniref:NrsF family protein n=1 Tax=Caballeronia sp. LjRoot31 TaxID=3342324 RepID=UPI003ECD5BE8
MILSAPTFIAVFWAMKGLAPTRPVIAGAAASLLSGAQAVLVYTLYCVEMTIPLWAVWYVLGRLVPTVLGGFPGPGVLRR